MQCWNCEFENIPGAQVCARCASSLELGHVDVVPPRAARLHTVTRLTRAGNRLRSLVPGLTELWRRARIVTPEPVDWRALAWSIIPGLGHLKTGRLKLGKILLPAWLAMLLLTLATIGTSWNAYALTGAVVVHAVTILSLFAANIAYEGLLMRVLFGLAVFVGVRYLLYDSAIWLGGRFCTVICIDIAPPGTVLAADDALLCEGAWMRPAAYRRGDVVLYRIDAYQDSGFVVRSGMGVNRVVGVPGDHVKVADGVLFVNGVPPTENETPFGGALPPANLDFQLGQRSYAVFTILDRLNGFRAARRENRPPASLFRQLSVVRHDDIVGRVIVRLRPFSRFGRLR
jgi:signal peptidase I